MLSIISSSPGELEPVFQTMLEKAVRICQATFGNIYRWDGHELELVASHNVPPAFAEHRRRSPYRPSEYNAFGRMIATKTLVHAIDAAAERAYTERREPGVVAAVELGGARTYVAVPLLKDGGLIGVLTVYRKKVRPFTDKQIELLSNFAAQAVIAIENTRLLSELRQSLEQQTATSNVLEVISRSAFDLQAVFETVAESSVRLCGADRAFIFRYDGELLRMIAAYNSPSAFKEWVAQHPIRPGRHSGSARAALERRTIHIPDVRADPEYTYGAKTAEAIRTILGVPILKGDELLGVMMIYRLEVGPFTDKQSRSSRPLPTRPRSPSRMCGCSKPNSSGPASWGGRWRICAPRRIAWCRPRSLPRSASSPLASPTKSRIRSTSSTTSQGYRSN